MSTTVLLVIAQLLRLYADGISATAQSMRLIADTLTTAADAEAQKGLLQ
ncbi:MAG: hypothetical protein JNL62_21955 [Bryobacterales bacterium]|nr:hypothetical protein [Bryobacterales bacterium]